MVNEYKLIGWVFLIFSILGISALVFSFVFTSKELVDTGKVGQGLLFVFIFIIFMIGFSILFDLGLHFIKRGEKK
jgi:hypothetical protein